MIPRTLLLLLGLAMSGCASQSTVVTGTVAEAVDVADVRILYRRPDCEFEEVAWIGIPGDYFSKPRLIDAMREQAAALGAEMIQIIDLQTVGSSEYRGTARALRCR